MKRLQYSAFTLVELLVVIAIIGILIALMLPAIQASRESARRAQCTNQLSQLIIAVHDYEMAHERFPTGTVDAKGPIRNLPIGHHISWIARILPYIEERPLYGMLDMSLSAYHSKNDPARQVTIQGLICPSCPADEWPYSNYAGCHHDVEAPIDADNRGVFFLNSEITRDDLKDGASYTLFLGEKKVDDSDLGWISGTPSTLRNTGSPINGRRIGAAWGGMPPWVFRYSNGDENWSWDNQQIDPTTGQFVEVEPATTAAQLNESTPPTDEPGDAAAADTLTTEDANVNAELKSDTEGFLMHSKLGGDGVSPLAVGGFASAHIGGVNFAFGDGSVRFINDDVSAGLLGRLANRADGNVIDGREFP